MGTRSPMRGPAPDRHRDVGAVLVPWVLLFLALGTFAPCVLLPEWYAYQAVRTARQVERHRVHVMQEVVDRERRLLKAVRTDPAVTARLARRELGFTKPGDRWVRVSIPAQMGQNEPPALVGAVSRTPGDPRRLKPAAQYDYGALFCDDQARPVIITMAVALMGVALWLPGRRSSKQAG